MNECANGLDNCDENANCINREGGFECVCGIGYTGDGVTCQGIFVQSHILFGCQLYHLY